MPTKTSSRRPPQKPLSRAKARNAALVNQLATPGLGSLLARRWVAGIGQLILAVAGFALFVAWFVEVLIQFSGMINSDAPPRSVGWLAEAGALTFIAAWLWALITSLSLLREARRNEAAEFEQNHP